MIVEPVTSTVHVTPFGSVPHAALDGTRASPVGTVSVTATDPFDVDTPVFSTATV